MDFKAGLLVLSIVAGCFALPTSKDDMSIFFDQADRNSRIVGGTEAAEGSHPHMVALTRGLMVRSFFCGGSVVGRRSVLTAGHCIGSVYNFGILSSSLRVTVGSNRWNVGDTYMVQRNATHPGYDFFELKNDIGLLITNTDIALYERVQIVPLTFDFIPEGVKARLAGWGRIRYEGPISATLLEIETKTMNADECKVIMAEAAEELGYSTVVDPELELCILNSPGMGGCNGDSGSPLIRIEDGKQFALVSWGFVCAVGRPEVHVRISAYQSWLTANII